MFLSNKPITIGCLCVLAAGQGHGCQTRSHMGEGGWYQTFLQALATAQTKPVFTDQASDRVIGYVSDQYHCPDGVNNHSLLELCSTCAKPLAIVQDYL